MIILGIDPGTALTGCGIIEREGGSNKLINYNCITTAPSSSNADRLVEIDRQLRRIIRRYRPQVAAVEDLFFFKNVKTAIKVSQARGVILARIARAGLPVFEYTPLQVKMAVTGYGRANKTQVQKMVKCLLCLEEIPKPDDAADALAVAICCAHSIP